MQVKTQHDGLENYLTDASNMPGGHAEKLFVPENAGEIAEILREANSKKIPTTISGARTGTVGGAIPFGGYVISLEKLNKIREINKETQTAIVEPGVVLADFQKAVETEGLYYPPDPTEWSCQIGGTVATNASGARSFKYGATRKYVERLKVVLAAGDQLELSRGESVSTDGNPLELTTDSGRKIEIKLPTYIRPNVRKNVSGFFNSQPLDAIDLFIGSEGTLGVITEIELSLLSKPEGFFSGIVFFQDENDLLAFVERVRSHSLREHGNQSAHASGSALNASLIEYFDDRALRFISEKFSETPSEMSGAIFFEQETTAE
ncbi:MAG: FAD-binding oxidoreductase, partial [Pyrinomonadaceae bacterium]